MKNSTLFTLIAFLQLTTSTTWCMEENNNTENTSPLVRTRKSSATSTDSALSAQECRIIHDENHWEISVKDAQDKSIGTLDYKLFPERKECYIVNLEVLKNHRGKGYGTRLLTTMESVAQANKCKTLSLEVAKTNKDALRLYIKLNYRQTSNNTYDLFYRMEKKIMSCMQTNKTNQ